MNSPPSPTIMLSQYQDAQDPLEGLSQLFPIKQNNKKMLKRKRENPLDSFQTSFVINKEKTKGLKLIQIKITDLNSTPNNEQNNEIINAQYMVKDHVDVILDETENLIRKISKAIVNNIEYD